MFLLLRVFIAKPLLFIPTHSATIRTLLICEKHFPKKHQKNGPENAFRHALWNVLIAKKCFSINNSIKKSVNWAKTTTDLHEKMAPNNEIETAMDLHNNAIGRNLFAEKQLQHTEEDLLIVILIEKMKTAVKVSSLNEMNENKNEFVYIEDLKTN